MHKYNEIFFFFFEQMHKYNEIKRIGVVYFARQFPFFLVNKLLARFSIEKEYIFVSSRLKIEMY